ncbi:MAG: hypothetical protein H6737_05525 [Alphaproteobacteria bacterium]|nr:hypothetical protein [Alphaproteobacteria bacterium]
MSVPAEPPERVAHLVRSTPGEVRFRSVRKQSVLGGLGLLGGVGTAWMAWFLIAILASVGASGFRAEEVVGSVVWLTIVGAMSGGGLGLLLGMSGRDLVVGEGSMRYTGVLPPAADRPVQLVLTGSPGHPMVLESESQILAKLFPSASQRGWDFDSVTWLGQRVSDLLGVRIRDERPEAEWRRWASDPLYRAQKQFDALLSKNQTEFHAHHATEPDPPAHSSDVDGMRIALDTGLFSMSVLKITPTHLIVDNRRYRLDSITRAGVAYRLVKTKNSRTWYGRLQVLVDGRVKTLVNLRVERHGGRKAAALNWLAATIAEHAGNARDLGSAEDVPEDLARIVRPAVLEGS